MASGGRKRRLACTLDGDVLEKLSMKLNPRMLMKDYQSLAGRFKYTYDYILNFARERDPTLALLNHWWTAKRGKEKTVSVLIEHLSAMERDDCVELLQPYEFYSSHEALELDERPVIPGAPDMNINPYNPHFPAYEHNQQTSNCTYELQTSPNHPIQYEDPLKNASAPEVSLIDCNENHSFPFDELNQRMATMQLVQHSNNNFSLDEPAMKTLTTTNVHYPQSSSSSMDSLQFEKHFLEYENVEGVASRQPRDEASLDPAKHDDSMGMCRPIDYERRIPAESNSVTVAADKVALVIGNQDYAHHKLQGLFYPEKDAHDVTDALRRLQFKVISLVNLTLSEMRTAMLAFCCLLGRGVYGVVYYAGHAYEDNGENYLLPVDSDLKYNRDQSLRIQEILEEMQQCDTSLNLLIVDACRVSLPNKSGINIPRIKRSARGNNIFAYSCCSQQECLEEANFLNGMYCSLLLERLCENRRIESILMDVATDYSRKFTLSQRPCLETDAMTDFRLTDPIQSGIMEEEFENRCHRWLEAQREPREFSVSAASLQISLRFQARFSNILQICVTTEKKLENVIDEFHLSLEAVHPLRCVLKACERTTTDSVICSQVFELQNIQKHIKLPGSVILTLNAMFKENSKLCHYNKEFDLGWPLVSSITCLWDRWLNGDQCKSTTV
ncbi:uncharacterized protein LOC124453229 isoform X2 [Xenia sp. Carnegie-2017]|uniref:uncharacterized protein LOC124453229 isoform X2 n=1 Tax=Xenia sp. Carnegie-2017 TaxID=2897299 RepID=UPI001F041B7C|nr:uncharacterized protein LOC124453229 isoform X2 [Xenia sp. Carnegie-2017]